MVTTHAPGDCPRSFPPFLYLPDLSKHQAAEEAQSDGASGEGADQAGGWKEQVSVEDRVGKADIFFGVRVMGKVQWRRKYSP